MTEDRRIASLLAFAFSFEATAHDDVLDLFDLLMQTTFSRARQAGQQERLLHEAYLRTATNLPRIPLFVSNNAQARTRWSSQDWSV